MYCKQINILTDCLDALSIVQYIKATEHLEFTQRIIDTLGSYPRAKADCKLCEMGAYLFTSTA